MTLKEIFTMLNSVPEFSGKVVYRAWPINSAPELPWITYVETGTSTFAADGTVYSQFKDIDIELYSANRDETSEALIESELAENGIVWKKSITYIDDEKIYQTLYEIEV